MLLNLWPFALIITASILYGSSLGWQLVVGFWVAFLVATFVVGGVFAAPGLALVLKLIIAFAMLAKGKMGSSSFS